MHRYIIHYCVTHHLDRELDCIHVDHLYCTHTHTHSYSNIIMVFEAQRPNDTSHIWSACVLVCLVVIGWKFWLIENDRDHLCIGFVTWSFVTRSMGEFNIAIENDRFLLKRYTYEKHNINMCVYIYISWCTYSSWLFGARITRCHMHDLPPSLCVHSALVVGWPHYFWNSFPPTLGLALRPFGYDQV